MKNYTIYNAEGEILRTGTCPDSMFLLQKQTNEFIIESISKDSLNYILNGVITQKLNNTTNINKTTVLADTIDTIELTNLPDNCTLLIIGEGVNNESTPTGNSESITFDTAGTYIISIKVFPYLDYEVEINAT